MKNTFYILMLFIGVAITGCEPMDDINEEIDENISNVEGSLDYTLEEEDYGFLDLPEEQYEFDTEEDARALIPVLLSNRLPALGGNSSVNVSYNVFAPIDPQVYTVSAEDYEAAGLSDGYLGNISQIQSFLQYQFPRAEAGDHVELTYDAVANEISYTLDADDFDFIENELGADYPEPAGNAGQFNSFTVDPNSNNLWTEEMILEAINIVLLENMDGVEGQKYNVSYEVYNEGVEAESMTVVFNGNNYIPFGASAYELVNADYALVAEELAEEYPGPAGNAGEFNTFTIDSVSDNFWTEEMRLEAINIVLMDKFPSAEEGAQFAVTYAAYDGSVSSQVMAVVLQDGQYVIDLEGSVSTVETTDVFAYTNGTWSMPLTLDSEDYTTMGQTYPNFDDEGEAYQMISVFLGLEYPYAREGEMRSVAYDFYSGSTSTRYTLFVFEDGEWNAIPRTLEQTLQFSHNGSEWEPDNTIRYTLVASDYEYIAAEFAAVSGYEAAASNLAQYGNFNLNNWDDDMILEALKVFLNDFDPSAEVGQKYILSYEVYPGYIMTQMRLIKDESGAWVINE
ncbi:hypothetical protein [Autumnicola edwardsiae]|uniref:DUF5017 domain-containing protein n=1 Tax=Autumnicola edwardsiae TaxID=3075594 RepID=A0ABU3CQH3_9FLAO|nr:hypothetical protein [Zunongwangia sp. F297]MDT0648602.1 hypothetical protein [Zunongwangia sp. F297]